MANNKIHPLVQLAKTAAENYILRGEIISLPADFPKTFLKKKAGVFVTIKNGRDLRGCIGTYADTKENIARETIANAICAVSQDFRFDPITAKELPDLGYEVYVLNPPEKIKNVKELNVKKYGILVRDVATKRAGLLLPDLEGVDSVEEQILIAAQKGGIDPKKETIEIFRFTAEKY